MGALLFDEHPRHQRFVFVSFRFPLLGCLGPLEPWTCMLCGHHADPRILSVRRDIFRKIDGKHLRCLSCDASSHQWQTLSGPTLRKRSCMLHRKRVVFVLVFSAHDILSCGRLRSVPHCVRGPTGLRSTRAAFWSQKVLFATPTWKLFGGVSASHNKFWVLGRGL